MANRLPKHRAPAPECRTGDVGRHLRNGAHGSEPDAGASRNEASRLCGGLAQYGTLGIPPWPVAGSVAYYPRAFIRQDDETGSDQQLGRLSRISHPR